MKTMFLTGLPLVLGMGWLNGLGAWALLACVGLAGCAVLVVGLILLSPVDNRDDGHGN